MTSHTNPLEGDEFLKVPALFKYGPWSLVVAGVLLSVAVLLAGQWRVVEGRKGEYEKAFVTARVVATAATENFNLLQERLWQSTKQVQALQEDLRNTSQLDARLSREESPAAPDDIRTFTVTAEGKVLSRDGAPAEFALKVKQALADPDVQGLRPGQETYVEATEVAKGTQAAALASAAQWTTVVHRLNDSGHIRYVAHMVAPSVLLRVAERSFGPLSGRVFIKDAGGRAVFEASNVEGAMKIAPLTTAVDTVSTVEQAMATPLDFKSSRLLASKNAGKGAGISAVVGLRESSVLTEFKARVSATWLIIGLASACWLAMALLVAYALAKFKRTEAYLRRLATTDILTGLPNRRSFQALLSKEVAFCNKKSIPLALFFIDLDNFKYVNDSMGHPVGDALLRHVAELLHKSLRPGDHVCRLAGDEFTILARGISTPDQARTRGEQLLLGMRELFVSNGVEIESKASMGVALLPLHTTNETDLMRFADTALYRAKQQAKGHCAVYDDSMVQSALAKAQTVRELERAIAQDELFLVYQPKYHLATGTLTSHEALVRWAHPTRGTVFPNDFIALAEEAGLIEDLGNWVLRRAVRQIKQWRSEGKGWHKVAVNVSPLQLRGDDFIQYVKSVLVEYKVPGRCLQVELTESTLATDPKRAKQLVHELRRLDVTVAIDDFGTGYSSLSTLSQFEIDCLKVDRSFINVLLSKEGESICRAIIGLGHSLNMSVVAEGVETQEQAQVLAQLGCNEVQGYLYAKPQPADVAVTLLKVQGCLPQNAPTLSVDAVAPDLAADPGTDTRPRLVAVGRYACA